MRVIDAFSRFDSGHPLTRPGEAWYLVAPGTPPPYQPTDLQAELSAWPRAAGGLLPVLGTAERELAFALDEPWWCGLLLAPGEGRGLLDPCVKDLLTWPEAELLPIVIDCGVKGFSKPRDLKAFLEHCPVRPVILTHGGQLNISGQDLEEAEALFKDYPHTCLESSGIYRQDFLERMTQTLGPRRILYGSGYPRMDEFLERERIEMLPLEAPDKELILGGNTERLFLRPS